jgi:tyrosinase
MYLSNILAFGSLVGLSISAPLSQTKRSADCPEWNQCTADNLQQRVDFNSMPEWERKAFTDSMKCLMNQPSQLDQSQYPAAINKYFDYAVVHVGKTQQVHLSGFFLTWHRMFLHLMEQDLRNTCGYTGRWPYWNFAATAGAIESSPILNGDDYSMSGNGEFVDTGPIQLGPSLSIPHGTGGGCVTTGPFANLITTLGFIDPVTLQTGTLPDNAYALNQSCLRRDLNDYVATTYTNYAQVQAAVHAVDAEAFELALNGIIGSSSLGVHSGAHFEVGGQMNSIHVSAQDPIWYPLHTFIDLLYDSWQRNNPAVFDDLYGTGTALNTPPTDNVTLDTIEPDWNYFEPRPIPVRDLLSTTSGPFCYEYDIQIV